jgi:small GTP-binding protein
MGFIFSKILDFFSRSRNKFKIIILGIQNAGKTTILYRLSIGQLVKTTPTIGSNVEEISYNNVKLQAWDLGGQESSRSVWDIYFTNTDAIIYVIDTNDETYDDSKEQFYKLLKNETLRNAVILIYANKQDLPGAKNVSDIIKIYGLDNIKDHVWHIQSCSAQTGEGLITGMKWLSDQLIFKSDNSFPINPYINYKENNSDENNINTNINNVNNTNENKEGNNQVENNEINNIENNYKEEKIDENDTQNNNNDNINNPEP